MTNATSVSGLTARRALHLAGSPDDFSEACRFAREVAVEEGHVHWILATQRPHPKTDLPPHVEWIRLPDGVQPGHGDDSTWVKAVRGLVEALEPDAIYLHREFGGDGFAGLDELEKRLATTASLIPVASPIEKDRTPAVGPSSSPIGLPADRPLRVGYVLKKFPRYSETFILREVLALEALGVPVQILSLHTPRDGRFHASLADLGHTVEYLGEKNETKSLPSILPLVQSDPAAREAFSRLLWETVDRGRPELVGYLVNAVRIADRARALGITHLHAHFATSATEVARMAAQLAGITFSFTAHAKDIYADDVDRPGLDLKFADCRFAVTVCDANERFLHERHPSSRGKARRLYNGIDLTRVTEGVMNGGPENGRAASSDPALPTILAVGRFVEKKGFDLLLHALASLRERGLSFRCRILGDGELYAPLREQRDALGLTDVVDMPGAASSDQVRTAMREATVLACPCRVAANGDQDALPTVLLEAMANRLACIGTPVGGIGEILDDGRAGLMTEVTAEALTEGLHRMLTDHELRARLATAGWERAQEQFDIARNVARLASWFEEASGPAARETSPDSIEVSTT